MRGKFCSEPIKDKSENSDLMKVKQKPHWEVRKQTGNWIYCYTRFTACITVNVHLGIFLSYQVVRKRLLPNEEKNRQNID